MTPRPAAAPGPITLSLPGGSVRVTIEGGALPPGLDQVYPFHRGATGFEPEVELSIRPHPGSARGQWMLLEGDSVAVRELPSSRVAEHLEWLVTTRMLQSRTQAVPLHAGSAVRKGHGILFPGGTGAGKTTLVLALRRHGIQVLGDDITLLAPSGLSFRAFPRSFRIKEGSLRLTTYRDVQGDPAAACSVPARLVVFPERCGESPPRLAPVGQAEALRRLLALTHCGFSSSGPTLDALTGLVRNTPCYTAFYGEASLLPEPIESLLEELHG